MYEYIKTLNMLSYTSQSVIFTYFGRIKILFMGLNFPYSHVKHHIKLRVFY